MVTGVCVSPPVNFKLLQRALFIKQGRVSAWAALSNYRSFPAVSGNGIRAHTCVPGYARQPKADESNVQPPVLSVLQPRVVSKRIWHVFCVASVWEQVACNNWSAGIAWMKLSELSIINCMKWSSYIAVVHKCVCVCTHSMLCACIHTHVCGYSERCFLFCFFFFWFLSWKLRTLGLNHKGILTGEGNLPRCVGKWQLWNRLSVWGGGIRHSLGNSKAMSVMVFMRKTGIVIQVI